MGKLPVGKLTRHPAPTHCSRVWLPRVARTRMPSSRGCPGGAVSFSGKGSKRKPGAADGRTVRASSVQSFQPVASGWPGMRGAVAMVCSPVRNSTWRDPLGCTWRMARLSAPVAGGSAPAGTRSTVMSPRSMRPWSRSPASSHCSTFWFMALVSSLTRAAVVPAGMVLGWKVARRRGELAAASTFHPLGLVQSWAGRPSRTVSGRRPRRIMTARWASESRMVIWRCMRTRALSGSPPLWRVMVPSTPQISPITAPTMTTIKPRWVRRKPVWCFFHGQRMKALQMRLAARKRSQRWNHGAS